MNIPECFPKKSIVSDDINTFCIRKKGQFCFLVKNTIDTFLIKTAKLPRCIVSNVQR